MENSSEPEDTGSPVGGIEVTQMKANPGHGNTGLSGGLVAVISIACLTAGLALGAIGMYAQSSGERASLASSRSQLSSQKNRVKVLSEANAKLSDQVKSLTPTATSGTSGLTVLQRNLTTRFESQVVDYVVRNDTDKPMDDISIDFRFLDKDGNSVGSTTMGNNAQVEPGKTGTVTVYVQEDKCQYPSAVKVQAQQAYGTINGRQYQISLPDDPGIDF